MKRARRAYRPEVVAVLEARLALSHVAVPTHVQHVQKSAHRAEYSTVSRPDFTVTWNGPDGVRDEVLTQKGRIGDGQLITSVDPQLPSPELMAIGVPANVALVTITYENESKTNITSATISDTLNPDLTLVPGSATSSTTPPVTTTIEAGGAQTVELSLAGGIAPDTEGYVQFEVARDA